MAREHFRVAIVGAGPAGATAANALCLAGVRGVALIDRSRFPRDKACGDAITGAGVEAMRQIGLDHLLSPHSLVGRIALTAPSGTSAVIETIDGESALPPVYVIPRKTFDAYLAEAALERGAADMTGWQLDAAHRHERGWLLELSSGEASARRRRLITADFLIGADGAASRVRRSLGLALNSDKHCLIAVRAYATARTPLEPLLQFDTVGLDVWPGYGWVFSCDPQIANIGIGTEILAYKTHSRHLRDLLASYASYLGEDFTIDESSVRSAPLPHAGEMPRLALPEQSAALIGDAASMINRSSGEGIAYGMMAGLLLGRALADAALRGGDLGAAAVCYEREFKARFRGHLRSNTLVSKIVRHRALLERLIRRYSRSREDYLDALNVLWGNVERPASLTRSLLLLVRLLACPATRRRRRPEGRTG
jgi:geranylgeranyl reductase family protein